MVKNLKIHRFFFLFLTVLFAGSFQSCVRENYKLGLISGLSGGNADSGEAGRNGALLAVEKANHMGGIKGRNIDLLIRDDGNRTEMAAEAARDLVARQVKAIIGAYTTTITEAIMTVTEPAGMLVFSPMAEGFSLAGKDDYLFRLNSSTRETTEDYTEFMIKSRNYRRTSIAIHMLNISYTGSWVAEFEKAYSRSGGRIVSKAFFNPLAFTGYSDLVRELLVPEPEAVLIVANSVDVARIAQQIRKVDTETPILAIEWAALPQMIELGGKAVEGIEILQPFDKFGTQEKFLRFVDEYRKRFRREPNYSSVLTYETVSVILEAEKKRRKGESLKEAILRDNHYQGLQQELVIDKFGDTHRDSFFIIVRNGKFEKAPL